MKTNYIYAVAFCKHLRPVVKNLALVIAKYNNKNLSHTGEICKDFGISRSKINEYMDELIKLDIIHKYNWDDSIHKNNNWYCKTCAGEYWYKDKIGIPVQDTSVYRNLEDVLDSTGPNLNLDEDW